MEESWCTWIEDVPALGPRWGWRDGPDPLAQMRQGSASSRTLAPAPAAGCCWTWSCSSSAYASSSPLSSVVHLFTPSQTSCISSEVSNHSINASYQMWKVWCVCYTIKHCLNHCDALKCFTSRHGSPRGILGKDFQCCVTVLRQRSLL